MTYYILQHNVLKSQQNGVDLICKSNNTNMFHRLWRRWSKRDGAQHRAFRGHRLWWIFFTWRFPWGTNQIWHYLHETYLRAPSDRVCLFCLCFFHNRVPVKWNGKRRVLTILGTKSKIYLLRQGIYSHDSPSHLTFMFLNQQLSANGCWTARGRWNHMGKWWTTDWKHELQIERW